jgi:Tfp pilus assembly protein FimT
MGLRINQTGFSLLETILTTCLLSLIMAVVGYEVHRLIPKYRLNGAVQSIVSDFHLARMKAIGQNCYFRIQIFPGQNYYLLERESSVGSSRWPGVQEGNLRNFSGPDSPYYYPGVYVESSSNNPVFSPRGTVVGTTVILKNSSGQKRISLSSLGRVKVHEG